MRRASINLKKVLIISPHFPPVNAPDMQRIRMSLPYFEKYGWNAEIISVSEEYVEGFIENDLLETIPGYIKVHKTKAFKKEFTGLFGIGSVALRSIYHVYKKGCEVLKSEKFNLVFFSTSNFHICSLGPLWKEKFNIPFIIDFQDPWYYTNGNRASVKNKITEFVHKKLEKFTVPDSDGIISVSKAYIDNLNFRYKQLVSKPSAVINFGSSELDFVILEKKQPGSFFLDANKINVVYPGALTPKFLPVIRNFFHAFLNSSLNKENYKFYFVGTSYFKTGNGILSDLISEFSLQDLVIEHPNRISYFQTLTTMKSADIIFLPGSLDGDYNPSKICNAIMSRTPIFAVFHERSIVHELINSSNAGVSISFRSEEPDEIINKRISSKMSEFGNLHNRTNGSSKELLKKYEARELTKTICDFFDSVIAR